MTTRISVPLSKMDEKFISEEIFWKVISMLDWSQEDDDDAVLAPAVDFLSNMEPDTIYLFQNTLAEKLFQLDKKAYAENLGEDSYHRDKPFSSDNFLYARACVVANGKEYYEKVLANPSQMPRDLSFEALLSLAGNAYKKKTGQTFDYSHTISHETFSNPEGWEQTLWDRIGV